MKKLFVAACVVLQLTVFLKPADAASKVQIVKAYVNSPGTDDRSLKSLNAEYIVVKNADSVKRSLTGWTLRDAAGATYKFSTLSLAPGASVTVHTGTGTNSGSHRYWGLSNYVWNNSGDIATLKNSSGVFADSCKWGSVSSYVTC